MCASVSELPPILQAFLRELPGAGCGQFVELLTKFLVGLEDEGLENPDAEGMFTAITRAAALPWPAGKRLDAIHELMGVDRPRGPVTVTFRGNDMRIERAQF
jgi:hypothetical protein